MRKKSLAAAVAALALAAGASATAGAEEGVVSSASGGHGFSGPTPDRLSDHGRVGAAVRAFPPTGAGFADQSHFTREFRRHFGVTPGRYRELSLRRAI
jgi:hypothetical protein